MLTSSLALQALHTARAVGTEPGAYRAQVFHLLAFLLRYGPKSIDELLNKPVSWLAELANAIGEIMQQEKDMFEQGLATGGS